MKNLDRTPALCAYVNGLSIQVIREHEDSYRNLVLAKEDQFYLAACEAYAAASRLALAIDQTLKVFEWVLENHGLTKPPQIAAETWLLVFNPLQQYFWLTVGHRDCWNAGGAFGFGQHVPFDLAKKVWETVGGVYISACEARLRLL